MCFSSTKLLLEALRLTPLSRYPTRRETPSDAPLSERADVTAASASKVVEGETQHGGAHRDADTTPASFWHQPVPGVHSSDAEEALGFE